MAALRRRHHTPAGTVKRKRGIDAGACADHQPCRILACRFAFDDGGKAFGADVPKREGLRLKIVQNRGGFGLGDLRQRFLVHRPVKIGQRSAPIPHRPRNRDSGGMAVDVVLTDIGGQQRAQVFGLGIGKLAHGFLQKAAAFGQGDAGIRAADIGDK